MGKNGRMVGSDFTFSFFLPCAAFNISHLSLNYSLFKGERTQKISPHFDPITDITTTKLQYIASNQDF